MPGPEGSFDSTIHETLRKLSLGKKSSGRGYGAVEPGNIDLLHRPEYHQPDGSVSTVRSMSTNIDGLETVLPTILDDVPGGRQVHGREAVEHYRKTGKHLGKFRTVGEAEHYAQDLHLDQQTLYAPREKE